MLLNIAECCLLIRAHLFNMICFMQFSESNTITKNHRITECLMLQGTSGHHLVQTPSQAESPRACCTGLHLGGF